MESKSFGSGAADRIPRLAGVLVIAGGIATGLAQELPPQLQTLPGCAVPPAPAADTWPLAAADLLGPTAGALTFAGDWLLLNDTGIAPLRASIPPQSTPRSGGTITGTDPFTYTPGPLFVGTDVFTYEVTDSLGRTSIGLVKVSVVADTVAPAISISAPTGGTVSGSVRITAVASDNVGVVGVRFVVGGTQIGEEVTAAPFEAAWNTTLVADAPQTLIAIARDAAGNTATSAPVVVTVRNGVPVPDIPPAVHRMVSSDGPGKRTTRPFSTTISGAVLVAFVASGGPAAAGAQAVTVSGAGLAWSRVERSATAFGMAEIWTATANGLLTNVSVVSTPSVTGYRQSLTVIAFTGASGVGASGSNGAPGGAPNVGVLTRGRSSLVYAVGNDWDRAVARVIPDGQTKVREVLDQAASDTYWVQAITGPVAAGVAVTLNATAPTTSRWNMAAVEITASAAVQPAVAAPPVAWAGAAARRAGGEHVDDHAGAPRTAGERGRR